jgi:hypothetical protein
MIESLQDSSLHQWLNDFLWGFPIAEILHILMTGGFFGGLLLVDLRILGLGGKYSSVLIQGYALPVIWWLFGGVLISGAVLFMFMPSEYASNPSFLLKLLFILVGGLNAFSMHFFLLGRRPTLMKISASLSLIIWASTLACGRLIAYYYGYNYWD